MYNSNVNKRNIQVSLARGNRYVYSRYTNKRATSGTKSDIVGHHISQDKGFVSKNVSVTSNFASKN